MNEFDLKEGSIVADFGCGSGYFPISIAKAVGEGGRVIAIDVLPSALELVEGRARNDNLHSIETRRANLEVPGSSGLENNSVDMVLLANILHQSYKKSDIIQEAVRVLKQGGKLAIIEYHPESRGVGPRQELRLPKNLARRLAESEHLKIIKEFEAGSYHYGLVFAK